MSNVAALRDDELTTDLEDAMRGDALIQQETPETLRKEVSRLQEEVSELLGRDLNSESVRAVNGLQMEALRERRESILRTIAGAMAILRDVDNAITICEVASYRR